MNQTWFTRLARWLVLGLVVKRLQVQLEVQCSEIAVVISVSKKLTPVYSAVLIEGM